MSSLSSSLKNLQILVAKVIMAHIKHTSKKINVFFSMIYRHGHKWRAQQLSKIWEQGDNYLYLSILVNDYLNSYKYMHWVVRLVIYLNSKLIN